MYCPLATSASAVGLQLAEHSRPLPRPVAQDAGHRQLRIVVDDRLPYAAEEAECGVVPVAKRYAGSCVPHGGGVPAAR